MRFQETINLTEEEKLLLKKGKLPEGRISERRSERSDAPEPSSQPEGEPQTTQENENPEAPQEGNGGNGGIIPLQTGAGGNQIGRAHV